MTEEEKKKLDEKPNEDQEVETSPEVLALAEKIGNKLVEVMAAKKEEVEEVIPATKIWSPYAGIREVSYPASLAELSKEETITNFFKALAYHQGDPASEAVLRTLSEGVGADGGYLVPKPLAEEIFRILPDSSVFRGIARVLPMTAMTLDITALTVSPEASFVGEAEDKPEASAEFDRVTLTANDLVCRLTVSEALLADATPALAGFLTQLFTEAIGRKEDEKFAAGSGTGEPKGISTETIASQAASAPVSFEDIVDLINLVPQSVRNASSAAFMAHKSVLAELRKITGTDGQPIWREGGMASGQTERLPAVLYGYRVYEQNDLPDDELYFGDWLKYLIGDRQAITVRSSSEAGDAWKKNLVDIKAVERVDGRTVMVEAFAKLTGIAPIS